MSFGILHILHKKYTLENNLKYFFMTKILGHDT